MQSLPDLQTLSNSAVSFVLSAYLDTPIYAVIFFTIVGAVIGWVTCSLFNGFGSVERRQLGQNYSLGYRKGFIEGAKERKRIGW